MAHRTLTMIAAMLTIAALDCVRAQVVDPIPARIGKRGLVVRIIDVARLPRTNELRPADQDVNPASRARVSFVRDAPDGRRFANDSRGFLYVLENGTRPELYADVGAVFPHAIYSRNESGFIGFAFHPGFESNGLFYTVHGEVAAGNPGVPDFIPPGYGAADVNHHNVITEWRATDPAATSFTGSRRELLRVGQVVTNLAHPFGYVGFNPTSRPGDEDYGLLYTSGSDLGFSNGRGPNSENPRQTQRLDSVVTAILRIDPRSPSESNGVKGLGDYTIPPANPFAEDGDPETLGEIYAYGFRNAHRLSWDLDDGTLFAADIGMTNIEEINIVHPGGNYGWMPREGYWENGIVRSGGALNELFALPVGILDGSVSDPYVYPVAIYDHDDGQAVTAGFTYHGRIPALQGKFIFGDLVRGRLFAASVEALKAADDGVPVTVAPIEEVQLYVLSDDGARVYMSFRELIERANGLTAPRADMHLSRSADGEIFVTSRQDGMIRMLVPDDH
jgi:hypothetical protein